MAWAPGSVSMTEDGDCGSGKDSEERTDRISSDRDVDEPQVARLVDAQLERERRGAAGSVDPLEYACWWIPLLGSAAEQCADWRRAAGGSP